MLVLHASVVDGQFLLWGETPAETNETPIKRRGRKAKTAATRLSPYGASADRLLEALAEVPGISLAGFAEPRMITAWLPTPDGKPIASSPLIDEPSESGKPATLAPWTVTALPLVPEQAVDLLCACVGKETLAPGIVVGATLAYWTLALRFAAALTARQQFLPSVTAKDGCFRAIWEPLFVGADGQRLGQLAAAMPGACRALSEGADNAPETPATTILSTFVGQLVDRLVRSTLIPAAPLTFRSSPQRERGKGEGGSRRRQPQAAFDSIHDQWLHALRSPDGTMTGDEAERRHLADQMREWRRPLTVSATSPFRLCFRLEEPPANKEANGGIHIPSAPWRVRYLLQAADDPSLLVPVEETWSAKGQRAAFLKRGGFHPREYLLASLGQAAGLCPPVEESLRSATPGGFELDATGAFTFFTEHAWLLEQTGFGVFLPAWWSLKGGKQRLTARAHVTSPSTLSLTGLSMENILHVDWQIALGGEPLSLAELEALAKLKAPLVKVRGQWVQLNAEEIQAALDFWRKKDDLTLTARDTVRIALGAGEAPGGLPFASVEATGWVGDLLAQLEGRTAFEELPSPDGFQGTLRPYQVRGYSWLAFLRHWGLGACLADDMGLGKTIQTLALIERDWHSGEHRPVLLVCPMSVMGNWQKEAARFTPELPVLVHHGLGRHKGPAFKKKVENHALVITSYALLHRDLDVLKSIDWAGVILDEAQNIKNPNTKQAQAARALPAGYRAALTGTPVENHVGDLWSIMDFLNPGLLGTQADFRRRFFFPIHCNREPEATDRLKRLTGPFLLRRLKTDKSIIADLPDKLEMKVFCNLTKEQASLYAAVVQESLRSIEAADGIQRKGLILGTLSKLKQVCNHPAHFLGDNSVIPGRSGKLARLTEMLEEVLDVGDRALVFTQFTEMGDILVRHLQETFGREVLFLHGATTKKQRDRLVERFQAGDGPSVFLLSLKAGGTGLNLTRANHVFHFDRWWNPAVENQATDRAFRIGQTRNVQVHKFLCVGTLEEKIDEMIERKQAIAAKVIGTGEGWLTELSTAQLKDLFALRPEALGE
jgi:SNF2 family DNA or RNA helicase